MLGITIQGECLIWKHPYGPRVRRKHLHLEKKKDKKQRTNKKSSEWQFKENV